MRGGRERDLLWINGGLIDSDFQHCLRREGMPSSACRSSTMNTGTKVTGLVENGMNERRDSSLGVTNPARPTATADASGFRIPNTAEPSSAQSVH